MKNFSVSLRAPVNSFREIRDGLRSPETRGRAVSDLMVYLAGAFLSLVLLLAAGYYLIAVAVSGIKYDSFSDSALSGLNSRSGLAKLTKNGGEGGFFEKNSYYRLELPLISTALNLTAVTHLGLFSSSTSIVLQSISVGSDIQDLNVSGGGTLVSFDLDFSAESPVPQNVRTGDIRAEDGSRSLVLSGLTARKCGAGDASCDYMVSAAEISVRDSGRDVSYSLKNVQLPLKLSAENSGKTVSLNKGTVSAADLRFGTAGSFSASGLRLSGEFSNEADSFNAEKLSLGAKQARINLAGMQQGEEFDFDQRFVVKGSVRNGGSSFFQHLSALLEPIDFSNFTVKSGPFRKAAEADSYFAKNKTIIEIKQLQAVSGDATTTSDFTLSNGYADFAQEDIRAELLFKEDFLANFSAWNDTVEKLRKPEYIKNSSDAPGYLATTIRYVRGNLAAGDTILFSR